MKSFLIALISMFMCVVLSVNCHITEDGGLKQDTSSGPSPSPSRNLVEEGRTFVHHAVKRMQFILPAIFFKMGIAFTLLILVTIVAVNNGFIGFMLLVVGLSSVLARLQEARVSHSPAAHVVLPPPTYGHGHYFDRSDTGKTNPNEYTNSANSNSHSKYYDYTHSYPSHPQYTTDVIYNNRYV